MKTKVISLAGGPGVGKSTLAADIFSFLTKQKKSVELVREWVKGWAWEGRVPQGMEDNLYILAKQLKAEKILYGKVEYIVTDHPIWLPSVYEELYNPETNAVRYTISELLRLQSLNPIISRIDLVVERVHPYVSEGRFQTLEKAEKIDALCKKFLNGKYSSVTDLESAMRVIDGS